MTKTERCSDQVQREEAKEEKFQKEEIRKVTRTQEIVTRDLPAETEGDSNQVQGEAQRQDKEKESRKTGDNYHISNELMRMYKAIIQPRTEDEISKIKESRIRRKEEEFETKAGKQGRREENTTF